jgi:predicted dehydrogenase
MGTVRSGAAISVFYRGGKSRGENLRWEINGSKGDLVLTGSTGHVQFGRFKLEGGREEDKEVKEMVIPLSYYELAKNAPTGLASNNARLYAQFANDIREGTHLTPDFEHALAHH